MATLNIEKRRGTRSVFERRERQRQRMVLINVEQTLNEDPNADGPEYRAWAHLGGSTVAAVAEKSGCDVVFHDENLQGFADLEKLITPGCIVGLSLVVTGIERGALLARRAKELGAKCVIAGNDAAIFRARQLLMIPGAPIDAVFTASELRPIHEFLTEIKTKEIKDIQIPGVAVTPPRTNRSNVAHVVQAEKKLRATMRKDGRYKPDFFHLPKFDPEHLEISAQNYRLAFAKQHPNGLENVRPALALFAQGCTRTGEGHICKYCTIADVGVISLAEKAHLKRLLAEYEAHGINYVFNVTDSSFGMVHLLDQLEELGAHFSEGMVLYARAYELAQPNAPELIRRWKGLTGNGRVVFNMGLDSGSERMLQNVNKASKPGSRLEENWQAIRNIKEAGAYAHMSVMFGIPGEDRSTCEETLQFVKDAVGLLGDQVSQAEGDIFWLNFGSPAAVVFTSYAEAKKLSAQAGKTISKADWERDFYRHRDALSVPKSALEAWYRHFTNITYQDAVLYRAKVKEFMKSHPTAAPGREFAFSPTPRRSD